MKKMSMMQNFRNWQAYRRTFSELSRLSNRELADLGISRHDIPRIARNGR
jgi:uncharacterized protein YjiS (DUF1127 family)